MSFDSLVNFRNDVIFKVVFGYEKNEKILISLLNEILGLTGNNKIVKLSFLNTFNIKEYLKDKLTSLDVKVIDGNAKMYNVEMQVEGEKSYIKRIIYYHDKLYTSQLKESEPYEKLSKSISISILNFELLEEKEFHNIYRYLNIKSKKELTELKEMHFIELPKFLTENPEELKTKFEKWVYALKYGERYASEIEELPEILNEEEIVMALREMRRASEDDEIREILEMREKARHDEASRLYNAKIEGEQIGIAKGKIAGKAEEARNLLLRLLRKKFKKLPKEIENRIKILDDLKTIEKIVESVFELKSTEQLIEMLNF